MILALLPLFRLVLAPASPQDVSFEQTTTTTIDGVAGPTVVSRVWASGPRLRLEVGATGGLVLLLQLDTGRAFRLDPAAKVAEKIALEGLRARSHRDASVAGDLMGASDEDAVRTRALGSRRTIAGHACTDYRLSGPLLRMDLCVSAELASGLPAFADFLEWSGAEQSLRGIVAEVRRLPGFPLETTTRVEVLGRVHQTRSTITRIRLGPQPRALFEPPPGFRVLDEEAEP